MRIRKRPIELTAYRFNIDDESLMRLERFTGTNFRLRADWDRAKPGEYAADVYDKFHDTWIGVKVGQVIVEGTQGEFYPLDPEAMAVTYDIIED